MAVERVGGWSLQIAVAADLISTGWSDIEPTKYGRHQIQPRGGKPVSIRTPQGQTLSIRDKDIIHLRGPEGRGKVFMRFTAGSLPEGYSLIDPMKGDLDSFKLSQ